MKNIKVYDKENKLISDENKYENENDFINHIVSTNYFGKPERWVLQNSEPYNKEHVIKTKTQNRKYIVNEINELGHTIEVEKIEKEKWVLLKADYTIEIIDLDKDYDYLLNECHTKRKSEYPPIEDYLDSIVKNDEIQKQNYIDKCLQVKSKYPKPIRSNT